MSKQVNNGNVANLTKFWNNGAVNRGETEVATAPEIQGIEVTDEILNQNSEANNFGNIETDAQVVVVENRDPVEFSEVNLNFKKDENASNSALNPELVNLSATLPSSTTASELTKNDGDNLAFTTAVKSVAEPSLAPASTPASTESLPDLDLVDKEEFVKMAKKVVDGKDKIYDVIKIDPDRATAFGSVAEIFTSADSGATSSESKIAAMSGILDSEDFKESAKKDSSLGIFAKIAAEVISEDTATSDKKAEFLGKLTTEAFGYLKDPVADAADKDAEAMKMTKALSVSSVDTNFGKTSSTVFEDVFKSLMKLIFGLDEEESKKKKVEDKILSDEVPEEKSTKDLSHNKTKLFLEEVQVRDVAILGSAGALALTCCIMIPGAGFLLAAGIMYLASTQVSGAEKLEEKEFKDLTLDSMPTPPRAYVHESQEAAKAQNIGQATEQFVEKGREELEEQKEKLRGLSLGSLMQGGLGREVVGSEKDPVSVAADLDVNTTANSNALPKSQATTGNDSEVNSSASLSLSRKDSSANQPELLESDKVARAEVFSAINALRENGSVASSDEGNILPSEVKDSRTKEQKEEANKGNISQG